MTTEITPHRSLSLFTPDTVAECWNGIIGQGGDFSLYDALWACLNDPRMVEIDREDCGPADVIGINCVADFWDRFDANQRARLNAAAEANAYGEC